MKWQSCAAKTFITFGIVGIAVSIFLAFLGGCLSVSRPDELKYINIAMAFFGSGVFLLISGVVILGSGPLSEKKSS